MKRTVLILFFALFAGSVFAQKITFGVITDVHEDLQKDATTRLQTFLDSASNRDVDFIIELGDLSHGTGAKKINAVWEGYKGEKYHTFGNHDTESATLEQMLECYSMKQSYYSFAHGDFMFLVLDAKRMSDEQLVWLERQLISTNRRCIIFSHEAYDTVGHSAPRMDEVNAIVARANKKKPTVLAMFCGHHHIDAYSKVNGIHYFQINSSSYHWADDGKFSNGSMAEYRDPLFAFVTLDAKQGTITLEGRSSEFLPPAPSPDEATAVITSRKVNF